MSPKANSLKNKAETNYNNENDAIRLVSKSELSELLFFQI